MGLSLAPRGITQTLFLCSIFHFNLQSYDWVLFAYKKLHALKRKELDSSSEATKP